MSSIIPNGPITLDEIAIKHGCDKSSLKHDYCKIYEEYFTKNRFDDKQIFLLEIGYGGYDEPLLGGESVKMWRQYLHPASHIQVVDICHKSLIPKGVEFIQEDATTLHPNSILTQDVIIDDGSHINADIITTFKNLWPALNHGGLYFVEDVHSSYDPHYDDSNPIPGAAGTAMEFFTRMAHSVNRRFIDSEQAISAGLYLDIEFIHFYKDLIIIKKSAA